MLSTLCVAAVLLASTAHGEDVFKPLQREGNTVPQELVDLTKPMEDGCSMVHQASIKSCLKDATWGCDLVNNILWATRGCRGTFIRKTHPHIQIRCGEGISPETKYECELPVFDELTDVEFFDPMGDCDATLSNPVVKPFDLGVPIPEFGVCFKNKSGHWNVFECLGDGNSLKQTIFTDETCTEPTKFHTKSHETIFVNGVCNLSGGNYKMILEWETKPCPIKLEGEPKIRTVCGFPGFKLKMRKDDRTKTFKYVDDACACSLLCQGDDAWQFHIKRGKCHCRARPNRERINRTVESKNYVSSFPIDD